MGKCARGNGSGSGIKRHIPRKQDQTAVQKIRSHNMRCTCPTLWLPLVPTFADLYHLQDPVAMTLFSVEKSRSVNSVLTPSHRMEIAVLDRTPYRMLGLGTYLVTISQVLHLVIYRFQEYSVLSPVRCTN